MKRKNLPKNLRKINLNAAGIDIGSDEHYVAVPEGRDEVNVKSFKTFTSDLHELAAWLSKCGVKTVAMESTGVYWLPLFQILEAKGFEVFLVNAHHVKNVPGRKTDVKDCQWLQELHTYGLLSASFQPDSLVRQLRAYMRQRDMLVRYSASHIQHMQKALIQMNIRLSNVISDIAGETGMGIIRDILRGERNPDELVKNCRRGLKNSSDVIKKSLEGNYTEEYVFILSQNLELYESYQSKIKNCDNAIESLLKSFPGGGSQDSPDVPKANPDAEKSSRKAASSEMNSLLTRAAGVDLLAVKGFNTVSLLTIISETGIDMTKWKTVKHFTSWLGLSPNNKISGGKVLSSRTKKIKSYAGKTFRLCAQSLSKSQSSLGAFYRRLKSRLGAPKANTATARKLASIFFIMLRNGVEYKESGSETYDQKFKDISIRKLKKNAKALGFQLLPIADE